jgi:hypothetical protein
MCGGWGAAISGSWFNMSRSRFDPDRWVPIMNIGLIDLLLRKP